MERGGEGRGCKRERTEAEGKSPLRSLKPLLTKLGTGRVHNNPPHHPATPLTLFLNLSVALSQTHMTGLPCQLYLLS